MALEWARPVILVTLCALQPLWAAAAPAAPAASSGGPTATAAVFTRATVRGVYEEDGGRRLYIRLKLVPRGKIPFSTLTFRVLDRALVAGLADGASVAFRAERIDGENTLTAIRPAPPCERFRQCD